MDSNTGLVFGMNAEVKEQLSAYEKRMLRHSLIRTICGILALTVVLAVYLAASDAMVKVNDIMVKVDSITQSLDTVTTQVEEADVAHMLQEIRVLVNGARNTLDTTATGMDKAINKMESIDIDTLNAAINDLAGVVEPLARFFGR